MRLTKEQAIAEHRKMWNWIADQIEKAGIVLKIYTLKERYFKLNKIKRIYNNCFLCEFADENSGGIGICESCPLNWGKSGGCMSNIEGDGLYELAIKSKTWQEQAALARQIANLPERTDV